MAAGVHHALVLTGEGQARLLVYRQGVDVRTEGHALAGALAAVEQTHHGGGQGGLYLVHAHLFQLGADQVAGAYLGHAHLGMGVNIAADGHKLVENAFGVGFDLRHGIRLLSKGCAYSHALMTPPPARR